MTLRLWLLLAASQCMWGGTYAAMKVALRELSVVDVVFFRYGIATVCLVLVSTLGRASLLATPRKYIGLLLLFGSLVFFVSPMCQVFSLKHTLSSDTSILVLFEPLITLGFAALILKEKMPSGGLGVMIWMMIGFVLLSDIQLGFFSTPKSGELSWGRLLGNGVFMASLCIESLGSVLSKPFTKHVRPLHIITWMAIGGFLTMCGYRLFLGSMPAWPSANLTWAMILFLAVLASAFGYVFWVYVIERAPVQEVAMSLFLQPIFGVMIAYMFLEERISSRAILGAAIIGIGLLLWNTVLSRRVKHV